MTQPRNGRRTPEPGRAARHSNRNGSGIVNPAESLALTDEIRSSIRILIVDDEHTLRESCASVLGLDGFSVSVCGNGNEAQTMLKRREFDIVLLDLHMSQVTCLALLETCLEAHPDSSAIIMSGNSWLDSS